MAAWEHTVLVGLIGPARAVQGASMIAGPRYRLGTQGWDYEEWAGRFYPRTLRGADRLELYARVLDTVEIDATFYAVPPAARFASWRARTPADFMFAVKLPGSITHGARLVGVAAELTDFCQRAARLEEKLGPLLIQLPPDMGAAEERNLVGFLTQSPREFHFAVEVRAAGLLTDRVLAAVAAADVTLAISRGPWRSTPAGLALLARAPGRNIYLRWMGAPRHQPITSALVRERAAELGAWVGGLRAAATGREVVFGFFNNDYQGHSPASVAQLQDLLGLERADASSAEAQRDLFG